MNGEIPNNQREIDRDEWNSRFSFDVYESMIRLQINISNFILATRIQCFLFSFSLFVVENVAQKYTMSHQTRTNKKTPNETKWNNVFDDCDTSEQYFRCGLPWCLAEWHLKCGNVPTVAGIRVMVLQKGHHGFEPRTQEMESARAKWDRHTATEYAGKSHSVANVAADMLWIQLNSRGDS